jgi:uncharacterized membrane protein YgdD (TMEM256/DUF423 family)
MMRHDELAAGALTGLLAVVFGAVASHGLQGLPPDRAGWIDVALRYQMLHSAAFLALGILKALRPARLLDAAGWAFVGGLLVFSGLLYAMALGAPRWLGALVPLGGLSYMIGWAALLAFALGRRAQGRPRPRAGTSEGSE